MRWTLGALVLGLALASAAAAREDTAPWGPFTPDMPLKAFRTLPGYRWAQKTAAYDHKIIVFTSARPRVVGGEPYRLQVDFIEGKLETIRLWRRMDQPEAACRARYEALLADFERRYGQAEPAQAFDGKSGTVLDLPEDESGVVVRHEGLQSASTLYRTAERPTALMTRFDFRGASITLTQDLRAGDDGAVRCTGETIFVH